MPKAQDYAKRILQWETLGTIAASENISRERVRQILKSGGFITSDLITQKERLLADKIKVLAGKGLSLGEIATTLGFSYCQIRESVGKQY